MHVVIIGNGIAGCSLATALAERSEHSITLISEENPYPFARTSLMYLYMGMVRMDDVLIHPKDFWKTERISRIHDRVTQIKPSTKAVVLQHQEMLHYDVLVIATGSKVHRPFWWAEELQGVTGLYHLRDLQKIEILTSKYPQSATIAGGGLIGIELAEMLLSRGISTTMIVRESAYMNHLFPQEEAVIITQHIRKHGVQLILEDEIEELISQENAIQYIRLKKHGLLPCTMLGVTTGVLPDHQLASEAGILTRRGIVVNDNLQTSSPSIYAIGDCAELQHALPGRKTTEAVWYSARQMGEQLAEILVQQRESYQPRIWYNSAAFFSLHMQQYGDILPGSSKEIISISWQQPQKNKSIRVQYHSESKKITGILCLGVRLRHTVCEQWLSDQTPVEDVIRSWIRASFEPEFSENYHQLFQQFALHVLEHRPSTPQQCIQ
ncbi:MAG: FAD-dependent oxidoreductase [Saprospiraceae bacterium]|nr:FAD-dependent oxidoreductase [Saprospiraceae bacterium]